MFKSPFSPDHEKNERWLHDFSSAIPSLWRLSVVACIRAEIGTLKRNIAAFRQPIRIGAVLVQRSFQLLGRDSLLNEFFKEIRDLIRKESEPVASESLTQKRDRLL